jgi:hypothetical protein
VNEKILSLFHLVGPCNDVDDLTTKAIEIEIDVDLNQTMHSSMRRFNGKKQRLTGAFCFERNLTTSHNDHWMMMMTRHYRMFQASRLQWMIYE